MAVSFRGATSANGAGATATSVTPTLTGTSWAAGDLVLINIAVGNTGSFTFPAGWTEIFDTSNAGSAAFTTGIAYRVMQAGDTDPAITFSGTAGKWAWTAIALQPGTGEVIFVDANGTAKSDTTTATTHTANATTAVSSNVTSVILSSYRASANAATAITTTPPTNWTEPTGGDTSTATGTTTATRQISTAVSYRTGQSGTVTPGSETTSVSTTANVYNVLVSSRLQSNDAVTGTDNWSIVDTNRYRIFPTGDLGAVAADTTNYTLGVEFYVTAANNNLLGYWWWCASGASTTAKSFRLYSVVNSTTGTAVSGSDVTSGTLVTGWNYVALSTPVSLTANQRYRAAILGGSGANWYSAQANGFPSDIVHGPLTAPSTTNATGACQGSFIVSATMAFPTSVSSGSNYGLDVYVETANSNTPINDSDTSSGTEAQSIAASSSQSDTSSSTETNSISATFSNQDTGSGTESQRIAQTNSDAGSGTENQSLSASFSNQDTSSATETQVIRVSSSDAVAGTDNQSISTPVAGSDTGSATEAQSLATANSEAGAGTEAQTISAGLSNGDTAASTETQVIRVSSSDSVSSVDNGTLAVSLSNSDQGSVTEQTAKISTSSSDAGSSVDSSAISAVVSNSDTASGTENNSLSASVAQSDTVASDDQGSTNTNAQKNNSDTVASVESNSTAVTLNFNDAISSQEAERLNLAGQDAVTSSESQSIKQSQSDNITASEGQIVYIFSSDGVTAVENQNLAATVAQADSASLDDMWIVDASLSSNDSLSATESELAAEALGLTAEFSTSFIDTTLSLSTNATYVTEMQDGWSAKLRTYTEDV